MSVNCTASCTITVSGLVAIGAGIGAATATSGVTMVALAALALLATAFSVAAISAWVQASAENCQDAGKYFEKIGTHMMVTLPGTIQVVGLAVFEAVIKGIGEGVALAIRRAIAGDDHTVTVRHA